MLMRGNSQPDGNGTGAIAHVDPVTGMVGVQQAHSDSLVDSFNMGRIADVVPPMDTVLGLAVNQKGRPVAGAESNGFAVNAATGVNAVTNAIDLQYCSVAGVGGLSNTSGNLEVQVSQGGSLFFTQTTIAVTANVGFAVSFPLGWRYVRGRMSAATTWTGGLSIVGKG